MWVLDYGLPALPARVGDGESVPVAYWAGPILGAVLSVEACQHDPECPLEEHLMTNVRCFRRSTGGWEFSPYSAGTEWPVSGLHDLTVDERFVEFDVEGVQTSLSRDGQWSCCSITAALGRSATWIDLVQDGEVTRCEVDSPAGAVVVAFSDASPATIRVLDRDELLLGQVSVQGASGIVPQAVR